METCINLTFFLCLPVGVEVQMGPGLSLEINCGFALIYLALFAVVRIQFFSSIVNRKKTPVCLLINIKSRLNYAARFS